MRTHVTPEERAALLQHLPDELWFQPEMGRVDSTDDGVFVSSPQDPNDVVAVIEGRVFFGRPSVPNLGTVYVWTEYRDGEEVGRYATDQWFPKPEDFVPDA